MNLDAESALNLAADEGAVGALVAEHQGGLARDHTLEGGGDPAIYWVILRPRTAPTERYIARVEWFSYPYEPPSIKFATEVRGSLTVTSAWPLITGYRAGSYDICRPFTREGFALHPEWRVGSTAWPTEGNPFLWVVQTMQFHFDNEYQGRSQ